MSNKNKESCIYISGLDEKITYNILWELCIQTGPLARLSLFNEKSPGHAYAEYQAYNDAEYSAKILNGIKLFGKPVRVSTLTQEKKSITTDPCIFIGNISDAVTEDLLRDIFEEFGTVTSIVINSGSGMAKITYSNFIDADAAITKMNGQYLGGQVIRVDYAYKDDTLVKHGSVVDRLISDVVIPEAEEYTALDTAIFSDIDT